MSEGLDQVTTTSHRHRRVLPSDRGRNWRRAGGALTAVVSTLLFCAFGYGWYEYRQLTANVQRISADALSKPVTHTSGGPNITAVKGSEMNILVAGMDSRQGLSDAETQLLHTGEDDSTSTDTLMIIHVPANGAQATLISIPRDSYVDIPGYAENKINAAYADGYYYGGGSTVAQQQSDGVDTLVQTVENLTGLDINHYLQVGFGGFYTIAKAIGGIPVTLCNAVDDSAYSGFDMSAGFHDLTPVESLEFVRQRHGLSGGDLARERRQQYFLAAAFNKMASAGVLLNPSKLSGLIGAIDGAITVDNGLADNITTLARQMINLSAGNIKGYTIPTEGAQNVSIVGQSASVEVVDPTAVQQRIAAILNGSYPPAATPGSASPTTGTPSTGAPSSGTAPTAANTPAAPTEQACID